MLVDNNLADVQIVDGFHRQIIAYIQPGPEQALDPETGEPLVDADTGAPIMEAPEIVIDEDTGQPKTEDYIQRPPTIEAAWDDAELAAIGWYKLRTDPRPSDVRITGREREFRTVDGLLQAWEKWLTEPFPATDADVNGERARLYRLGTTVDLGEGLTVPVDTRDTDDENNIQGLFSFGREMRDQGVSAQTTFRGSDNEDYVLTVQNLIDMGLKVLAFKSAIYAAARVVKAQIEDGTLTDAVDIPDAFDAILTPTP